MEEIKRVARLLHGFFVDGVREDLKKAHDLARSILLRHEVARPDEIRTLGHAITLELIESGIECMPKGKCGADRICRTNKVIDGLGTSGVISTELADGARVVIPCGNRSCHYRPHLRPLTIQDGERGVA